MAENVLYVKDLHVNFQIQGEVIKVINGLSFTIDRGEVLGLVGETGSGKSVAAAAVVNLVRPPGRIAAGKVLYGGQDLLQKDEKEMRAIRGKEISVIVQNARAHLNPLLRVGDQIANVYQAHQNISKKDALEQAARMIRHLGIPHPERRAKAYPHELSGGMAQRIIIGMALACSPKLLVADEPTSGLDVTIQAQILDLMQELIRDVGSATLLITGDLGIVANYCRKVAVMYRGQIVEYADVDSFFDHPRHPYSKALLASTFLVKGGEPRRGTLLDRRALPTKEMASGCYFHPRCTSAIDECQREQPELAEINHEHAVRCHIVFQG